MSFDPFSPFPKGPNSLPGASVDEIFVIRPLRGGRGGVRASAPPSDEDDSGAPAGGEGPVPEPPAASAAPGAAGTGTAASAGAAETGLDPRRLEVFLFEKGIAPRSEATTSEGASGPYAKWVENGVDTADFEAHGIHVQIVHVKKLPVPFAKVKLMGPVSAEAECDGHGFVTFKGLRRGEYVLASEKNGYKIGRSKLVYPTAKTVPGHIKAAG